MSWRTAYRLFGVYDRPGITIKRPLSGSERMAAVMAPTVASPHSHSPNDS